MTHLGERVSDLVDGRLSPQALDRAHGHLARCPGCRDAVVAERLIKARLSTAAEPQLEGDLLGRLISMGGPAGPLPPTRGHVPGSPRPRTVPIGGAAGSVGVGRRSDGSLRPRGVPAGAAPRGRRFGGRSPRRGSRHVLTAAVMGALGAVGAGVAVLSSASPVSPATVVPVMGSFVVRQAATNGGITLLDLPASWQLTRQHTQTNPRQNGSPRR